MPVSPLLILGGLGLFALLSKKGDAWDDDDYSPATEMRKLPNGKMARYFRASFVASVAQALGQYQVNEQQSTMVGGYPVTVYTLDKGATDVSKNALAIATSLYGQGMVVFVTVNIWDNKTPNVAMLIGPPSIRSEFAIKGKPWAILADSQYGTTLPSIPGTTPGTPGTPGTIPGTTPGTPGTPGTIPPNISVPPSIKLPDVPIP